MRSFSTVSLFCAFYISKNFSFLYKFVLMIASGNILITGLTLALFTDLCHVTIFFSNSIFEYDSSYPAFYRLLASRDDPRK